MEEKDWMKLPYELRRRLSHHLCYCHIKAFYGDTRRSFKVYPENEPVKVVCLVCGQWFEI